MREKIRRWSSASRTRGREPVPGEDKMRQGYKIEMFMTVPGLPESTDTISESDLVLRVTAQWCKPSFQMMEIQTIVRSCNRWPYFAVLSCAALHPTSIH